MNQERPVHFICSLGTTVYKPAVYALDNRTYSTKFAPVAVASLLGLTVGRATVLATAEAADRHYEPLRQELEAIGLTVELARANAGISREDIIGTLSQLIGLVKDGERVVLDVTHGFRHLPFIYFAALSYLTSFKSITLEGIFYGAYELGEENADGLRMVPVIDLMPMFEVSRWSHAVQSANESGDLRPLQRALDREVRKERALTHARAPLDGVLSELNKLAPNLAAGLPLGTGIAARRVLSALRTAEAVSVVPGFAHLSLKPLEEHLADWAVPEGVQERAGIRLDAEELRRQLRLIRWYAERENVQEALLLLREWLVTCAAFEAGESTWLGYDNRKRFESVLNAAAERARRHRGIPRIGVLWKQISEKRNLLAHADTDEKAALPSAAEIGRWIDACEALIAAPLDLAPPGNDRVLLTPLGLTPGVLYTATSHVRPDQAVVVTSREAESSAAEALTAAGMPNVPRTVRTLDDPFGVADAEKLVKELLPRLSEARELTVNLTGGTTAMQLVVERLAQAATRLGIPVQRILLIDRRPVEEQRREPHVLGEVVPLDEPDAPTGAEQEE